MPQNENKDPLDKIEKITRIGNLALGAAFTIIQIVLLTKSPDKAEAK